MDATLEQTMDASAVNGETVVDATLDGSMSSPKPKGAKVSHGGRAAKTVVEGVDATMDQTVNGTSELDSATPSKSVVRSGSSASSSSTGKRSKSDAKVVKDRGKDEVAAIPERLGGYRIIRLLGRGAMGAVYEAKQVSLDRIVALKTIRHRFAKNPASLARFTREAYAAAQLTHHNVVQIYDFGEDSGRHFFSMEWVRGGPLSDLIHEKGVVDPKLAAGYILQAARGLQFAHQNGMVHRDVKPANLLLSEEGVVKVADLGLVKIPDQMDPESDVGTSGISGQSGTQVTMMGTAVGTPAYMAPEQGIDAASVDHRADIYSLGCSLFYMLAGRAPFDGTVVSEVLEQHAKTPAPKLVEISDRIPPELDHIVQKSMAKRPSDRYDSLADMIGDLEGYLGVSKDGSFSPSSSQADQWESIAKEFRKSTPLAKLAAPVSLGFSLVCVLLALIVPFASLRWLLFAPCLFLAAMITAVTLGGGKNPINMSIRKWISSLSWFDYAIALFGSVVTLLVVFAAGIWVGFLSGLILGAIAGAAFHFLLVMPTRSGAFSAVTDAEKFIRDLRIEGADEEGVRMFAARYGGKSWQPLFESLFGYESLCDIREQLSSDPSFTSGSTKGSLRDKVASRFVEKAEANRQSRDQKRLAKIEEDGLKSEGVSAADAREQAWQMAQAIIANAQAESGVNMDAAAAQQLKRERQKEMLAEARSGKYAVKRNPIVEFLKFAFSGYTRFLCGCILLAIFAIWAQQAGLLDTIQEGVNMETFQDDSESEIAGQSTSPWSIGLAGLLLCMSAFVSGWRMTPFALVATAVILFGASFGIPNLGSLEAWMIAGAAGIVIYVPGVIWGESRDLEA